MKELFVTSFNIFKRNKETWLLAGIVFSLIMAIGLSLSSLLGFGNLLLIFFVVCPFVMTYIKLAIKCIGELHLDNKDVYMGYKNLSISIGIVLKKVLFPILLSLIFYFLIFVVINYVYLLFFSGREIFDIIINMI